MEIDQPTWPDDVPGMSPDSQPAGMIGEAIITATVTAGVLPFVQTLATKAAEDTYAGVRAWLKGMFRESQAKRITLGEQEHEVLEVHDPASDLRIDMPLDASDEALRSLKQLDLDDVIDRARRQNVNQIRIYWDEPSGRWRLAD